MDKISTISKSKKVTTAKNRLNRLKEEEDLPDLIVEGIRKIDKNFNKLISHIENKDIPSTNNLQKYFQSNMS